MYAVMANCFLNVAGIPFGAGGVSSPLGGWVVVAAFLVSTILLSVCADRNPRLTSPDRASGWDVTSRLEQKLWGFRLRCAEAAVRNS
jgi:hypothetical protein